MADKDFKVKTGLDLGTPLPLTEGGTGQTSAANALNALLPIQTDNSGKVLSTDGSGSTSWVTLPSGFTKGDTASRPGSPSLGDIYSNTETGYIEVYTAAGWSQLGVIPTSATIGTATNIGTNRAYNNGSASVTFTPGLGGGLVSSYTVASTSGGYSASGTSSPIVVTGLQSASSYQFIVTATNGYGNALASTASNSITATTVPQSPTIGTASNQSGTAYGSSPVGLIPFTVGASGGSTITNYKYSIDGTNYISLSPPQTSTPLSISGLTSGQSYSFYIKAVNSNGDSVATSQSNSISASTVPQAPTIGTATLSIGQAYSGSASISVPFTPGATGNSSLISPFYTVTSSSGNTATGSSSPISISETVGNPTSTARTYTVRAVNVNGNSSNSSSSNSISAVSVPQTPSISSVTRSSNTQVSISFSGATGGAALSSVNITSSPSVSLSYSGTSSPITVSGSFVQGTAYTFSMTATNSAGTSSSSSSSGSLTPFPLPTLSAMSVSTVYPSNYYGVGATTTTNYLVTGGATDGQNSQGASYYWNGSSWVGKGSMPAWFGDSKFIAGTNGDNVQHIGNYQGFPSATLFSSATGSWSNGTSLPTTDLLYATIGFTDANKVHATSLNSGGTNYIRNGTGAWTASGTSPANLFGTANNRLNNNGWVWPQNGGTSYKLSGYGGTYSASIDFGYRPTVAWASQNNWTMYNENSTTAIYLVTDSGLISTGQTGPTLAGYTWLSYVLAGYGNELHMFAGRRTSPPNPSYPGVNLHYKATITN